jgi:hypothetical protein
MSDQAAVLCPSYRCQDGAILLGIVLAGGRVAFAADRIVIDQDFVDIARQGRSPEKRFRFSGQCVQAACRQWAGGRCGVIDKVLVDLGSDRVPEELPRCSIRPQCRWYLQSGAPACGACPEVITDLTLPGENRIQDAAEPPSPGAGEGLAAGPAAGRGGGAALAL